MKKEEDARGRERVGRDGPHSAHSTRSRPYLPFLQISPSTLSRREQASVQSREVGIYVQPPPGEFYLFFARRVYKYARALSLAVVSEAYMHLQWRREKKGEIKEAADAIHVGAYMRRSAVG